MTAFRVVAASVIFGLGLGAAQVASPAAAQDKKVELRFSIWLPPQHPNVVAGGKWAESIAGASNNTIKVTIYPAEQLGKAFDHHDMVANGIADMGMINTGYEPGRHPIAGITMVPFLMSNARGGSRAFHEWYAQYAPKDIPQVRFCLGYAHDPGALHAKKKITRPSEIKGMKIRPAQSTIADFVTLLGGATVQASAPQARDVLEKGVADAITFPWGSILLFGIDKAVTFHMEVPLYVTTFAFIMNKARYDGLSPAQKKVMDDHCSVEWSGKIADPWAEFEAAGIAKLKADPAHTVYKISDAELAEWRQAAEPLRAKWAERVQRMGLQPDKVFADLQTALKKYDAVY